MGINIFLFRLFVAIFEMDEIGNVYIYFFSAMAENFQSTFPLKNEFHRISFPRIIFPF